MSETVPTGPAEEEQERERLYVATQDTRFVLLQNILGHPSQLPSMKELAYINPSKSEGTIYQHLERLVEAGIVEAHMLPSERRKRDLPYKFYGVSDEGRAFLDRHGLLRAEETLRAIYERVEKDEQIRRFERAPRPREETDD
jgi:DNA-binding PadR family transcriptional regulator